MSLLSLALIASVALAQAYSAVIVGVVTNERGGRLAGAKVSLSKKDVVISETTADVLRSRLHRKADRLLQCAVRAEAGSGSEVL